MAKAWVNARNATTATARPRVERCFTGSNINRSSSERSGRIKLEVKAS